MNKTYTHITTRKSKYIIFNWWPSSKILIRKKGFVATCRQRKRHKVSQKIASEVSLALMERCSNFTADLLRDLWTHHGRNALGCMLGYL